MDPHDVHLQVEPERYSYRRVIYRCTRVISILKALSLSSRLSAAGPLDNTGLPMTQTPFSPPSAPLQPVIYEEEGRTFRKPKPLRRLKLRLGRHS